MAALLYLVLTFVSMVTVSEGNLQYLYFSGPGGAAYGDLPGFYGAAATYTNNASALDYPDSGVQCLNTQKGIKEGFDLKSISMDPRSRKVLLSLKHEFEISVTLATMTLCLPQEECGNATYSPDILFDNAQLDDVMSPVAYYDSTVYFLTTIDTEIPGGLTKRTVELRMLQGCQEKYPVNVYTSFYIADCSKLIVQLDEVEYDEENSMSPLTVSNSLYIINTGSESFFLTQLQRMVYDEDVVAQTYSMELILVKNSTKEVVSLHEEKVDTKFRRYELEHLGAINLRNNKLCWSAVDTILCADWSNSGSISNIVTVLPKGESSKACLSMSHRHTSYTYLIKWPFIEVTKLSNDFKTWLDMLQSVVFSYLQDIYDTSNSELMNK